MSQIKALVDQFLRQMSDHETAMMTPADVPPEMLDASIAPSDDWKGWKPAPSVVDDNDLNHLEKGIGYSLPLSYREFLKHKHFYELLLDDGAVHFPAHVPDKSLKLLRAQVFDYMDPELIIGRGYIYFADLSDSGALCFDANNYNEAGECPIVYPDHEALDRVHGYANNFTQLLTGDKKTARRFYKRLNEERDW